MPSTIRIPAAPPRNSPADYASDPIEIGFNARYLLDVAAQLDRQRGAFMLADAGSPTLIHDTADEHTLYVLMPMRV